MAMVDLGEEFLEGIDPQISKAVTLGADLRTFYFSQSDLPAGTTQIYPEPFAENFFQMQGNLYLSLQLTPRLSAHLSHAITETREVYGLAYLLPWSGYAKVGRFVPSFGWRHDDHTLFSRAKTGFFPPGFTDVGVELGIFPGPLEAQFGVVNGALGLRTLNDIDDAMALYGRAAVRFHAGDLGGALGGSVWHNAEESSFSLPPVLGVGFSALTVERNTGGPFGYLTWRDLSWVGEFYLSGISAVEAGVDTTQEGWITSHELTWRVVRGVDLRGTFDYIDFDTDADVGSQRRFGAGVEVMPYPFLKTSAGAQFYHTEDPQGTGVLTDDFTQLIVQVLFFY
jgi:hypothetical protein